MSMILGIDEDKFRTKWVTEMPFTYKFLMQFEYK